jgi:RNA polymerase sigma-70 factor (ECF subfamily)
LNDSKNRGLLQSGFRYAYSLTHQHHDAEDLVQEAWLKLCKAHGYVKDKPLLFVAIRHLFIDQYRRKNLVVLESLESVAEPATEDDLLQLTLMADDIDNAMNQLRPEEREVIFLNIVEGYTAREIAKLAKLSRNTILSLLHRGKIKLVAILKKDNAKGLSENNRKSEC